MSLDETSEYRVHEDEHGTDYVQCVAFSKKWMIVFGILGKCSLDSKFAAASVGVFLENQLLIVHNMYSLYLDGFSVVDVHVGTFYFTHPETEFLMKINLNYVSRLLRKFWNDEKKSQDVNWLAPSNECDVFGSCDVQASIICPWWRWFEPVNKGEMDSGNWTGGYQRMNQLHYVAGGSNGEGFIEVDSSRLIFYAFTKHLFVAAVVLSHEGIVESILEFYTLLLEIHESIRHDAFADNFIDCLSPWCSGLFKCVPLVIKNQLLLQPDSDVSTQLYRIEIESASLLAHLFATKTSKWLDDSSSTETTDNRGILQGGGGEKLSSTGMRDRKRQAVHRSNLSRQLQGKRARHIPAPTITVTDSDTSRVMLQSNREIVDVLESVSLGYSWTCRKRWKEYSSFCRNGAVISAPDFVFVLADACKSLDFPLDDIYADTNDIKIVVVQWYRHIDQVIGYWRQGIGVIKSSKMRSCESFSHPRTRTRKKKRYLSPSGTHLDQRLPNSSFKLGTQVENTHVVLLTPHVNALLGFPIFHLEDKVLLNLGGVDRDLASQGPDMDLSCPSHGPTPSDQAQPSRQPAAIWTEQQSPKPEPETHQPSHISKTARYQDCVQLIRINIDYIISL